MKENLGKPRLVRLEEILEEEKKPQSPPIGSLYGIEWRIFQTGLVLEKISDSYIKSLENSVIYKSNIGKKRIVEVGITKEIKVNYD